MASIRISHGSTRNTKVRQEIWVSARLPTSYRLYWVTEIFSARIVFQIDVSTWRDGVHSMSAHFVVGRVLIKPLDLALVSFKHMTRTGVFVSIECFEGVLRRDVMPTLRQIFNVDGSRERKIVRPAWHREWFHDCWRSPCCCFGWFEKYGIVIKWDKSTHKYFSRSEYWTINVLGSCESHGQLSITTPCRLTAVKRWVNMRAQDYWLLVGSNYAHILNSNNAQKAQLHTLMARSPIIWPWSSLHRHAHLPFEIESCNTLKEGIRSPRSTVNTRHFVSAQQAQDWFCLGVTINQSRMGNWTLSCLLRS